MADAKSYDRRFYSQFLNTFLTQFTVPSQLIGGPWLPANPLCRSGLKVFTNHPATDGISLLFLDLGGVNAWNVIVFIHLESGEDMLRFRLYVWFIKFWIWLRFAIKAERLGFELTIEYWVSPVSQCLIRVQTDRSFIIQVIIIIRVSNHDTIINKEH